MESHARRSNRARIVPAKIRENLEVEADIDTDTTNKLPSALKERTNRLSVNEGYTGPKNVVTLPSSSASSSSLSSDGGTFDSPNDAVIHQSRKWRIKSSLPNRILTDIIAIVPRGKH